MQYLTAYSSSSDDEEVSLSELTPPVAITQVKSVVRATDLQTVDSPNAVIKGYVSKRKAVGLRTQRQPADIPCTSIKGTQLATVKEYLSSIPGSPETKRAKKEYEIPRTTRVVFREHTNAVMDAQWHPFQPQLLLSASLDGTVKLWDAIKEAKCIATYYYHGSGVRTAKWIESNTIVSGGYDKCCKYVNIETEQIINSFDHTGFVTAVQADLRNKNTIITGDIDGNVQSWDLRTGRKNGQFRGAGGTILSIEFLHNGKEFIATSDIVRKNAASQAVVVWDIASTAVLSNQVYIEPYTCPCLKAHPKEPFVLAQSNGNYIVLFSSNRPYRLNKYKRYEGHSVEGFNVGFDISPDGRLLCSGSADGRICFYDYNTSRLLKSVPLSKSPTLAVAVHPSLLTTVAVSNWSGFLTILD